MSFPLNPFIGQDWEIENHGIKFYYQDYWVGRAFPVFRDGTERERLTNLIVALRASLMNYRESPPQEYDLTNYFTNEQFCLVDVGLASRKYVADHHIFRDGTTEDMPTRELYTLSVRVNMFWICKRNFTLLGNYWVSV